MILTKETGTEDKIRKIVIMCFLALSFLSAGVAFGQTWHYKRDVTVGWDAVAPLVSTDTIRYQVYVKHIVTEVIEPVGSEISAVESEIHFSVDGRFYIGVATIRYPAGETVGIPSETSWSSDPAACAAASPFGVASFVSPQAPTGLRYVE